MSVARKSAYEDIGWRKLGVCMPATRWDDPELVCRDDDPIGVFTSFVEVCQKCPIHGFGECGLRGERSVEGSY